MPNLNIQSEPKLDKPGAGLPFFESLLLKFYFAPFVASKKPFSWTERNFEPLHKKILQLVESIPAEQLETKCLVPKMSGLEDSSRYWSVKMTLEHILIVGTNVREIVIQLSRNVNLDIAVDIAKVKPTNNPSIEQVLADFRSYSTETIPYLKANIKDFDSPARLYHPWFGKINLKVWTWLLVGHASLHLAQLKEIKKVLENEKAALK